MFVPSLSWQNDHIYMIKNGRKVPFSYRFRNAPERELSGVLGLVLTAVSDLQHIEVIEEPCLKPPFWCVFPTFVPSLSGQMIAFSLAMVPKRRFLYLTWASADRLGARRRTKFSKRCAVVIANVSANPARKCLSFEFFLLFVPSLSW